MEAAAGVPSRGASRGPLLELLDSFAADMFPAARTLTLAAFRGDGSYAPAVPVVYIENSLSTPPTTVFAIASLMITAVRLAALRMDPAERAVLTLAADEMDPLYVE